MDNRLNIADRVVVEIYNEGRRIATYEGTGFHNVTAAISSALFMFVPPKKSFVDTAPGAV